MTLAVEQSTERDPSPATAPSGGRRRRMRRAPTGQPLRATSGVSLGVVVTALSLIVLLPLAAIFAKAFGSGWQDFWTFVSSHEAVVAVRLTVLLALAVAVVNAVVGTLVAWVLVREPFPGSRVFEMVIDIPFALPTIVAGVVMLALYGSDSFVGVSLYGSRIGLLVVLLFVTLPFVVRTVQPVLLDLDRDAEQAAASLGAGPGTVFRRIVLPQIVPAAVSGAMLAFARALGEYGSLVLLTSGRPNTEVASQLIYAREQDTTPDSTQQAAALSAVLLLVSAVLLLVIALVQRRGARRG
jgi:sulfate/thiosulfate transport system permease protein